MSLKISRQIRRIKPSPTLALAAKANQMRKDGINVINFGVGEPDFNTPEYIKNSGKKAIDDNFTRYTPTPGIPELKQAICDKLLKENNLKYEAKQIVVSPGAKASIAFALRAICDAHDQVIIQVPYWVSYPYEIMLAEAEPLCIETTIDTGFKIDPVELDELIAENPRVKAIILNTPGNPTGAVYTKAELEAIAAVCLKHDIAIISDEIYEKLVYDGIEHVSIASLSEEVKANTIVINGFSKAYAMTGWRLGYLAAPADVAGAIARVQGHTTSNATSISQKAGISALKEDDGSVEKMRLEFEKRKDFLRNELLKTPEVKCSEPAGAFYMMVDVSSYIKNNDKGISNSAELSAYLLENCRIAVVQGSAFGSDDYVRFSYANSMENLEEGAKRFKEGMLSMRG
ncbi:MAG: pyridoxal phosphate-dependent aminotransferase [Candidatus Zophobacter franzmannii]|nr:pyridoxal phosphate-dependent aminotransferase [Candidatus Zophobacter franzmannii]